MKLRHISSLFTVCVIIVVISMFSFSASALDPCAEITQTQEVSAVEIAEETVAEAVEETLEAQSPTDTTPTTYVNQFIEKDGKVYFFNENGELYTNQVFTYNGKHYVADENGALYLGQEWRVVQTSDSEYHYVNELGEMYVPTQIRIRKWRAIDTQGNILVKSDGIYKSGSKKYISDEEGNVYHGSIKVISLNDKKYICRENGSLYTGNNWYKVKASDGYYYYVDKNAKVYQPSELVIKNWHGVTTSGRFKTIKSGPFMCNNHMYIANSKGVIYHSGGTKKQLVSYNGKNYGVSASGAIYRGSYFKINEKNYYAYKNGIAIVEKSKVKLTLPVVKQNPELPTGCEITSVTQLIRYSGTMVDKVALAREMPYHSYDPDKGYVGDPFTVYGWTIYPKALKGIVEKYTGSFKDMTGCSITELKWQIRRKKPVVVWVGDFDGWNLHCVIVTGYDKNKLYFNDCSTGTKRSISITQFNKHWAKCGYRALSY